MPIIVKINFFLYMTLGQSYIHFTDFESVPLYLCMHEHFQNCFNYLGLKQNKWQALQLVFRLKLKEEATN
jgi:hypothetical protein